MFPLVATIARQTDFIIFYQVAKPSLADEIDCLRLAQRNGFGPFATSLPDEQVP